MRDHGLVLTLRCGHEGCDGRVSFDATAAARRPVTGRCRVCDTSFLFEPPRDRSHPPPIADPQEGTLPWTPSRPCAVLL